VAPLELSRRDLLAAYLGAPFAALACRERGAPLPPGELVGASHELGHRLREAPPPRPERWESHDVVIIGGGVAGLGAAWRLGGKTLVLELEPEIGGTSRSTSSYPWGAHYIVAPSEENVVLRKLLEEMGVMHDGVVGEEFLCRDPEQRVFYRGRWYEGLYLRAGASAEDTRQLRAFEAEIAGWSRKRTFVIPIARSTAEGDELDRISMAEWLDRRGFTSPRLRWLIEYACRDDYGTLLGQTSAWAAIFYFASRDDRPVITWPEGNGRLVAYLARYANVRRNTLVHSVRNAGGGVEIVTNTIGIRARKAIVAAPQFIASRLVGRSCDFTYGSWMVANLTLRDRPSSHGFPLAWDNVLYESPSLGYVVSTHQRGIDHGPTVITYYYPLCDADPRAARSRLLAAGRDEGAEIALADLSRAHPEIRSLTARIDVMRWGHAMIRPTPGFVRGEALRAASRPLGNIHFANTDLSGVALFEEALDHGVRAGAEVMAAVTIDEAAP
jgi:glycine/D-amino acid oxidase-like deaminating enzyme